MMLLNVTHGVAAAVRFPNPLMQVNNAIFYSCCSKALAGVWLLHARGLDNRHVVQNPAKLTGYSCRNLGFPSAMLITMLRITQSLSKANAIICCLLTKPKQSYLRTFAELLVENQCYYYFPVEKLQRVLGTLYYGLQLDS